MEPRRHGNGRLGWPSCTRPGDVIPRPARRSGTGAASSSPASSTAPRHRPEAGSPQRSPRGWTARRASAGRATRAGPSSSPTEPSGYRTSATGSSGAGRSRHGAPVRNRTGTACRRRRLSTAVPPGSDALPAGMSPIRAHMASVSTVLSALISPPARLVCAAFPACVRAGYGMEPDESRDDCLQTLDFSKDTMIVGKAGFSGIISGP